MYFKGHAAECLRVYLRIFYCIFIWNEVAFPDWIQVIEEDRWKKNLPIWVMMLTVFMYAQIERYCFSGTRLEVSIFGLGFYPHALLYSLNVGGLQGKLILNILLDIWCLYSIYLWVNYRQADMANLKIAGKYKVGFKRMKMGLGNSVLVFYPVNDSEVT